jgi:hypothetical protein
MFRKVVGHSLSILQTLPSNADASVIEAQFSGQLQDTQTVDIASLKVRRLKDLKSNADGTVETPFKGMGPAYASGLDGLHTPGVKPEETESTSTVQLISNAQENTSGVAASSKAVYPDFDATASISKSVATEVYAAVLVNAATNRSDAAAEDTELQPWNFSHNGLPTKSQENGVKLNIDAGTGTNNRVFHGIVSISEDHHSPESGRASGSLDEKTPSIYSEYGPMLTLSTTQGKTVAFTQCRRFGQQVPPDDSSTTLPVVLKPSIFQGALLTVPNYFRCKYDVSTGKEGRGVLPENRPTGRNLDDTRAQ